MPRSAVADSLPGRRGPLLGRLASRRALAMLGRNTVVSTLAFLVGLAVLWVAVEAFAVDKVAATALSFLVANSLHYALGRRWIFRGTDRAVMSGYAFFLVNGLVGMVITVGLFALLIRFTPIHYLAARILVSVVAGLAMFGLNAVCNFRRL